MGMNDIDGIIAFENGELDQEESAKLMQSMVNSGMAWKMQGSYGRACMDAINAGLIMLGKRGRHDYWGSYVPARDEVQEGTKGSAGYVASIMGKDWADAMAAV